MWLGFSLLYLGQNIKPYTSNGLGLSWKIFQKNVLPEFRSVESNILVPNCLEPNKLPLWQSVTKHKLKQNAQSLQKIAHYKNIAQHKKSNLTTIY